MRIGKWETHPAADVFPLMQGDEFDALVADIKEHGLREPVWRVWVPDEDGHTNRPLLLDGRNRARACERLGIEPGFRDFEGDDPVDFVVSLNLQRRHLNESQRSMVADRLSNLTEGRPKTASIDAVSQAAAADWLNVSRPSVQRARKVNTLGTPDLVAAVDNGDMAVSAAAMIADKPHDEQNAIVEMVTTGAARNVPQAIRRVEEQKRVAVAEVALASGAATGFTLEVGDAVELLEAYQGEPFQCVVTDPPYGISVHNTRRQSADYKDGDVVEMLRAAFLALESKCAPDAHLYVFSGYTNAHVFKGLLAERFEVQDNPIIWHKGNHTMCDFAQWYPNRHEYIWFCKMPEGKRRRLARCVADVISHPSDRETTHSAEKPVGLLSTLIEQSTVPGDVVADPFAGAGSTGVAALKAGRGFVGFELESRYADVARARLLEV